MTTPDGPKINRAALDRIIQRATELHTGEREVGDNLTPDEVLALGKDVGIPGRYLQQAMLEYQTASAVPPEKTLIGRLVGPAEVRAERVVRGASDDVVRSLIEWMDRNELMVIQRHQAGWVSWEPLRGMQAAIRRGTASLDTSKPKFMLSRAELVVATVTPLESGFSHVSLVGTLKGTRGGHVTGAAVFGSLGIGTAAAVLGVGLFPVIALAPLAVFGIASGAFMKGFRPISQRVQLGLDRALDFLERGGVKPGHELPGRTPGLIDLLANEVRRALKP